MIAHINRGEPYSDAGDQEQPKPLPPPRPVREEHVGAHRAVQAGEHVRAIRPIRITGGQEVRHPVPLQGHGELPGEGEVGAQRRDQGVADVADSVYGEHPRVEGPGQGKIGKQIVQDADGQIDHEEHVAKAEELREDRLNHGLQPDGEAAAEQPAVQLPKEGVLPALVDEGGHPAHVGEKGVHQDGVDRQAQAPPAGGLAPPGEEDAARHQRRGPHVDERVGREGADGPQETKEREQDKGPEKPFMDQCTAP